MNIKTILSVALTSNLLFGYEYSINSGWNLLGAVDDIENLEPLFQNGVKIWKYQSGNWSEINSADSLEKLSKGVGFWYYSNSNGSLNVDSNKGSLTFNIPDTNQRLCFDSSGESINCQGSGQDGEYIKNSPSFSRVSEDIVKDTITGLIWQDSSDINLDGVIDINDKLSQADAQTYCENLTLGGYSDWSLPNIKQLYSLIDFSGKDVSGYSGSSTDGLSPFLDTETFEFGYGDTSADERIIDAQWASSTIYVSTTMGGAKTMFGVNLADGRIKGYPTENKLYYVQCIRENQTYGNNNFTDNLDGTISDSSTNLMWEQDDSKDSLNWESALSYCSNLSLGSYSDWRVPNAKELQSIVDYTKSPDTTASPAIDSNFFNSTSIINEAGESDFGFYWSSTTHKNYNDIGTSAVYISFGRALGYMNKEWIDVHGAGAQRSDPKILNSNLTQTYQSVSTYNGESAYVYGPQGDVVRGENFVRCVRDF